MTTDSVRRHCTPKLGEGVSPDIPIAIGIGGEGGILTTDCVRCSLDEGGILTTDSVRRSFSEGGILTTDYRPPITDYR